MRVPKRTSLAKAFMSAIGLVGAVWLGLFNASLIHAAITQAVPSAKSLYQLSLDSDDLYSYTGRQIITVWHDDDRITATATEITHAAPDRDEIVYTAPRSRHGRVIIQSGLDQWTYLPQKNVVIHNQQPDDPTEKEENEQFALLLKNYTLKVSNTPGIVAGRKAYEIEIMPRMRGRAFERIWIDPFTGVVLRREKFHSDGSEASISYFSEIHYLGMVSAIEFSPNRWDSKRPKHVEQGASGDNPVDWGDLPSQFSHALRVKKSLAGYQLQSSSMLGTGRSASLHFIYSDGLNTLSLFETPRRAQSLTKLPLSHGVTLDSKTGGRVVQKYSYTVLSWDTPEINYTLVADMRLKPLVKIYNLVVNRH